MALSTITGVQLSDDGRVLFTFADGTIAYAATTGAFQLSLPVPPQAHRTNVTAADGTAKPAINDARWLPNPGNRQQARVFVTTTGAPTTCTVRPYLRSGGPVVVGAMTPQVGTSPIQTVAGVNPNGDFCFDIATNGDDLLCLVETLAGGTAPSVSIAVSWR
jgi:hypothetical protein